MTAGRTINSQNQNWGTPKIYVDAVRSVFHGAIDLDPCSNEFSVVGATVEYRLPEKDGLRESWNFPRIYVNPPYGFDRERHTKIRDWLARCASANRLHHSEVIALVPVATNTKHWKQHVWGAATGVAFLYDTRLKFLVDGKSGGKGAPMSCAMVYWGDNFERFQKTFSCHGAVIALNATQRSLSAVERQPSKGVLHEMLHCESCKADTCHRWVGRYECEVCGQ